MDSADEESIQDGLEKSPDENPTLSRLQRPEPKSQDLSSSLRPAGIVGVEINLPNTYPILTLQEMVLPKRRILIPLGMAEGVAISYGLKNIESTRPLTHEFFSEIMISFGVWLQRITITSIIGHTYHAEVELISGNVSTVLSCRPSDAIALALRQRYSVPFYIDVAVLDQAGVISEG